jgi:hypothetical protein
VTEDHRLPLAPILEVDLRAVFRRDRVRHERSSLRSRESERDTDGIEQVALAAGLVPEGQRSGIQSAGSCFVIHVRRDEDDGNTTAVATNAGGATLSPVVVRPRPTAA